MRLPGELLSVVKRAAKPISVSFVRHSRKLSRRATGGGNLGSHNAEVEARCTRLIGKTMGIACS